MRHERVEVSPNIMNGKPVVRGTRIPVELVLRKLGAGISPEAILIDHVRLTLEDIRAAQRLGTDVPAVGRNSEAYGAALPNERGGIRCAIPPYALGRADPWLPRPDGQCDKFSIVKPTALAIR